MAVAALWPVFEQHSTGGSVQAYWRLCDLWVPGEDLVLIQHEVVPHATVRDSSRPAASCGACSPTSSTTPRAGRCTADRFAGLCALPCALIANHPGVMAMAGRLDLGSGLGHWARLDDAIARVLAPLTPPRAPSACEAPAGRARLRRGRGQGGVPQWPPPTNCVVARGPPCGLCTSARALQAPGTVRNWQAFDSVP